MSFVPFASPSSKLIAYQTGLKKNTDARCNKRIESRVALLQGVAIPFFLVTFICIFLRLYTRWDQRIFKADDWIMLAVLIVLIPFVVQSLMGIQLGFGRNIWDVEPEDVVFVIRVISRSSNNVGCFLT